MRVTAEQLNEQRASVAAIVARHGSFAKSGIPFALIGVLYSRPNARKGSLGIRFAPTASLAAQSFGDGARFEPIEAVPS